MLTIIQEVLQSQCQLRKDQAVVLGVSGGPDSLCLLDIMDRLGYRPIVAYFNHKLRPEAEEEADLVGRAARLRNLPVLIGQLDVPQFAQRARKSIEEAAREARYQFLFSQARENAAQAVVVGHTADDQVETVLMHFLRGAGLEGLSGMPYRSLPNPWSDTIPLIRPLLGVWRTQIEAYCQTHGLQPVSDPSNRDRTFFRNRLRLELLPYLESYNPAVKKVIWRTAQVLQGDLQVVEGALSAAWEMCSVECSRTYIGLSREVFSTLPLSIQRRVIRRAIGRLREDVRDVGFDIVAKALSFIHLGGDSAWIDLIAGLRLTLEPDRIWIADWGADLPAGDWPQLEQAIKVDSLPAKITLPKDWMFTAEITSLTPELREQIRLNDDSYRVWLAREAVKFPLTLRHRLPGDRFSPLGLQGHTLKLSDFMINEKIPLRARDTWPLVCDAQGILWVPGHRLAHPYRIREDTRETITMRLIRPG